MADPLVIINRVIDLIGTGIFVCVNRVSNGRMFSGAKAPY